MTRPELRPAPAPRSSPARLASAMRIGQERARRAAISRVEAAAIPSAMSRRRSRQVFGQQLDRTLQQVDGGGRRRALASARSPASARRSLPAERVPGVVVGRTQLDSVPVRLLEVVGDDLLVLRQPVRGHSLQPRRETLMELGSGLLGEGLVRGVPDQQVAEPICLLAGERGLVGADQLHPHQAGQAVADLPAHRLGRQLGHRAAVEDLALDRCPLDDGPVLAAQPIQAGREKRLDGRRDGQLAEHPLAPPSHRRTGPGIRRR